MSQFVWAECSCGGDIVSVTPDEDDVRIAVASHQETSQHAEWQAVQALIEERRPNGPCICKGGEAGPKPRQPVWRIRRGAA